MKVIDLLDHIDSIAIHTWARAVVVSLFVSLGLLIVIVGLFVLGYITGVRAVSENCKNSGLFVFLDTAYSCSVFVKIQE